MKIKINGIYKTNEDMKSFITLREGVSKEPVPAGTICKVIEISEEWVTIRLENGRTIRTEDHMLSELWE